MTPSTRQRLKRSAGLDLGVVDYMQLMRTYGRRQENRQQETAEISRNLKALARGLDVPVIAATPQQTGKIQHERFSVIGNTAV